jgi:hypothetical protein
VVTGLALLNGGIQADLVRTSGQSLVSVDASQYRTLNTGEIYLLETQAKSRIIYTKGFLLTTKNI